MKPDTIFLKNSLNNNSKLKLELSKLKGIAPRRYKSNVSYADVVWFLLKHYKKTKT